MVVLYVYTYTTFKDGRPHAVCWKTPGDRDHHPLGDGTGGLPLLVRCHFRWWTSIGHLKTKASWSIMKHQFIQLAKTLRALLLVLPSKKDLDKHHNIRYVFLFLCVSWWSANWTRWVEFFEITVKGLRLVDHPWLLPSNQKDGLNKRYVNTIIWTLDSLRWCLLEPFGKNVNIC